MTFSRAFLANTGSNRNRNFGIWKCGTGDIERIDET
jgi:hypothetical protein